MRNLILPLSIVLSLFFASCGQSGDSSVAEEAEVVNDLPAVLVNGTNELDLSEYFMPFSMYVPDSNRGIPEVIETGYGVWTIFFVFTILFSCAYVLSLG